jgi:hypothetical protein
MSNSTQVIPFNSSITSGFKSADAFDEYFCLSGRKFRVIKQSENPNQKSEYIVEKMREKQNTSLNLLKIISYITGIIPLIMLIGKLICRSQYRFVTVFSESSNNSRTITTHSNIPPKNHSDNTHAGSSKNLNFFIENTPSETGKLTSTLPTSSKEKLPMKTVATHSLANRELTTKFNKEYEFYKVAAQSTFQKKQLYQTTPKFELTTEQRDKIKEAMKYAYYQNTPSWLKKARGGEHIVFFIDDIPGFVFKMNTRSCDEYIKRSKKARELIHRKKLFMLHAPQSMKIEVDGKHLIMEEKATLKHASYNDQKGVHRKFMEDHDLKEMIHETYDQLAQFITSYNFSDVKYDNTPFSTDGRIALIDLDEKSSDTGLLYGCAGKNDGLFNYIPLGWFSEFRAKYGNDISEKIDKIQQRRQVKSDEKYRIFLSDRKVQYPTQKISENVNEICEDDFQRDLTKEVLVEINKKLGQSKNIHLQLGRKVKLNTNNGTDLTERIKIVFAKYNIPFAFTSFNPKTKNYEDEMNTVLKILKDNGYIFKYKVDKYYPITTIKC